MQTRSEHKYIFFVKKSNASFLKERESINFYRVHHEHITIVDFHTFLRKEIYSSEAMRDSVTELICGLDVKGFRSQYYSLWFVIP